MPQKNQPNNGNGEHLDEDDLKRAEKGTDREVPLVANGVDVFVPDSELDNPDRATKEMAKKNDPTASRSADQ